MCIHTHTHTQTHAIITIIISIIIIDNNHFGAPDGAGRDAPPRKGGLSGQRGFRSTEPGAGGSFLLKDHKAKVRIREASHSTRSIYKFIMRAVLGMGVGTNVTSDGGGEISAERLGPVYITLCYAMLFYYTTSLHYIIHTIIL